MPQNNKFKIVKRVVRVIFWGSLVVCFWIPLIVVAETPPLYGILRNKLYMVSSPASYSLENDAPTLPSIVGLVISLLLASVGVIFLLLVIYGGYLWMYARGNEEEVEKAKDIVIDATIGLVIIAFAYMITKTVVNSALLLPVN